MPLYTASNGNRTGFNNVELNTFSYDFSVLGNDNSVAGVMGLDIQGNLRVLFKPQVQMDESGNVSTIVGNMFNSSHQYAPALTSPATFYPQIAPMSNIPEAIRPSKPLTTSQLEGTGYGGSRKKLGLILVPTFVPFGHGVEPPNTNVHDANFTNKMSIFGDGIKDWATCVKYFHNDGGADDIDDADTVYNKVTAFEDTRGEYVHNPNAPYSLEVVFIINPIQHDEAAYSQELDNLKKFYTVYDSPMRSQGSMPQQRNQAPSQQHVSNTITNLNDLMNLNLTVQSAADQEKISLAKVGFNKLRLLAVVGDVNFETGKVENIRLPKPQDTMKIILDSAGGRATFLQDLLFTAFAEKPTTELEQYHPLFVKMSMKHFSKPLCSNLIAGNFQSEPLSGSGHEPTTFVNVLNFLAQNLTEKLTAAIESDNLDKNEQTLPVAQRSNKQTTIEVLGSIDGIGSVSNNSANFCGVFRSIFDYSGGKSIIYQFAEKFLLTIESNKDFKTWHSSHLSELPHLPWAFISAFHSLMSQLAIFSRNMKNLGLLTSQPSNDSPDLDTTVVEEGVESASRWLKKLNHCINDGTIFDSVASFTPDEFNPKLIALKKMKNELMKEINSSGRNHAGQKSLARGSPPSSPMKASRDQHDSTSPNPRRKSSKRQRSSGGTNKPRVQPRKSDSSIDRKKLGWMHAKDNPTSSLPSNLSTNMCAFFVCQGHECKYSASKCQYDHIGTFERLPKDDQDLLLKEMDKDGGKTLWLDEATFDRQEKLDLVPSNFKYLLGDEKGPNNRT